MPAPIPRPPFPDESVGVFVSPRGAASNPGTRARPLDAPAAAIVLAAREGKSVFLTAGEWVAELVTSVSLYGGHSDDFSEHDPERHVTRVVGPDGGHSTNAVTIDAGEVTLQGLTLEGGRSKHAAAVLIRRAARAKLFRNRLHGGGRGPSPDGFTYSQGVNFPFGEHPQVAIVGNVIHGGRNQYCWGIDGLGPGALVEDNTIVGGASTSPNSSTYGIRASGGFTLRHNRIDGGSGADSIGLSMGGKDAIVVDNEITTRAGDGRFALVFGASCDPTFSGNTLDGVPDDAFYAYAKKLTRKTWIFNEQEGNGWSHDGLTLVPWGRLYFWSDGSTEPTGGGWSGPTQDFEDFLARGPAEPNTPKEIVEEVRAMLLAAGVTARGPIAIAGAQSPIE